MKPKLNLWQFKPPGLLGLDLEASARDRRLRLCGHTILKQSGLQKLAQAAVAFSHSKLLLPARARRSSIAPTSSPCFLLGLEAHGPLDLLLCMMCDRVCVWHAVLVNPYCYMYETVQKWLGV